MDDLTHHLYPRADEVLFRLELRVEHRVVVEARPRLEVVVDEDDEAPLALLLLLRPCGSQTVSSVVCVGDSITYGRTKVAEDGSDGYPHKLEARLGWSHWSVTNLGESGSTAQDVKGDGYVRYSGFYDEALALAADFYVVMLGTNDAKLEHWNATAYEAAIVGLCEAFVAVGGHRQRAVRDLEAARAAADALIEVTR